MKLARQLTTSEVAHVLGVGTDRVRQLDNVLTPIRVGRERLRLYDPAVVERVAAARNAVAIAKADRSAR